MKIDETTLTAFVLGEISDSELCGTITSAIEQNPELQKQVEEIRQLKLGLVTAFEEENNGALLRFNFPAQFPGLDRKNSPVLQWIPWISGLAASFCVVVGLFLFGQFSSNKDTGATARSDNASNNWRLEELDDLRVLQEKELLGPSATWSDSRLLANSVFRKKWDQLVLQPGNLRLSDFGPSLSEGNYHHGYASTWVTPLSGIPLFYDPLALPKLELALNRGEIPRPESVQIEALINGFDFQYDGPAAAEEPFAVHLEQAESPWTQGHTLLKIGVKGYDIPWENRAERNLVFLVDVSGSMDEPAKLPLVKAGLELVIDQMKPQDRLAVVTYGGASKVLIPSTPISDRTDILASVEQLQPGGNSFGQTSIQEAFRIAEEHFLEDGENKIIVCTDGDFSLGATDPGQLDRLIAQKAENGILLSVYGFSIDAKRDSRLESLAKLGGGRYGYVDTPLDVARQFSGRVSGVMPSIASDLKLEVEFNPRKVDSFRLIGYEDIPSKAGEPNEIRPLPTEIGSAYSLTALYELIPHELTRDPTSDGVQIASDRGSSSEEIEELVTVHVQYQPEGRTQSELIEVLFSGDAVPFEEASADLRFAAAVSGFGQILRNSPYKGDVDFNWVLSTAGNALGSDRDGYRTRFMEMVRQAEAISTKDYPATEN
jgi:Ca-activated chloride channel homolog